MKIEIYSPTIRRNAMVEEKIGPGERSRLLVQTAKEQLHFDYALALRSPAVALHTAIKALNPADGQGQTGVKKSGGNFRAFSAVLSSGSAGFKYNAPVLRCNL